MRRYTCVDSMTHQPEKSVIMSSLSCSTESRENADFFATIPSR